MKLPCELVVSHILPVARGAISRDLVDRYGMTQAKVAKLFGVTAAAVSQYLNGVRGGDEIISRSAYSEDFNEVIRKVSDYIVNGEDVSDCLCRICAFSKSSGLLRALYVYEGYNPDDAKCMECPRINIMIPE
mgnify:CR=1 FL=1